MTIATATLATIEPEGFDIALYKQIGLLIFFGIFFAIVLWLVLSRRGRFDEVARIPLDDEEPDERKASPGRGESDDG